MNERSKAILRRLAASHVEQTRTEEARPSRYWRVTGWVTTANGTGGGAVFGHRWALVTPLGGDVASAKLRLERYSWGSSFRSTPPAWATEAVAEALACEVAA